MASTGTATGFSKKSSAAAPKSARWRRSRPQRRSRFRMTASRLASRPHRIGGDPRGSRSLFPRRRRRAGRPRLGVLEDRDRDRRPGVDSRALRRQVPGGVGHQTDDRGAGLGPAPQHRARRRGVRSSRGATRHSLRPLAGNSRRRMGRPSVAAAMKLRRDAQGQDCACENVDRERSARRRRGRRRTAQKAQFRRSRVGGRVTFLRHLPHLGSLYLRATSCGASFGASVDGDRQR